MAGYVGSTRCTSAGAVIWPPIRTGVRELGGGGGGGGGASDMSPPTIPPTTPPGTPPSTPPTTPPSASATAAAGSGLTLLGASIGAANAPGFGVGARGCVATGCADGGGGGGGGGGAGAAAAKAIIVGTAGSVLVTFRSEVPTTRTRTTVCVAAATSFERGARS